MPEAMLMYSPLAEMSALQKLLAGDLGREHQICSPLQYEKCQTAECCLRHKLRDTADYKLCTPVKFTAQRMTKVRRKYEEQSGDIR